MNGATLKTVREALGLPIAWLSQTANVQERTARYWEARLDDVPDDVRILFEQLERVAAETVERGLSAIRAQIEAHGVPAEPILLVRYRDADGLGKYQTDMAGLPVTFHAAILARVRWAMQQEGVEVVIRALDAGAYEAWRRSTKQTDSPAMRAQFVAME